MPKRRSQNVPMTGLEKNSWRGRTQVLDVVVLRKFPGVVPFRLPDGFDDMVDHNLVSFKSFWQAFNAWAMKELLAHAVNYRKQISPSLKDLIPEDRIRCFGVCARFPTELQGLLTARQQ